MKYTYLLIDAFTILVPVIFSFHPGIGFYKNWKALFPAIAITGAVFVFWDSLFTYLGYWGFNPTYISGIAIGNMPLEELLFFICIPYACLFTFDCLSLQLDRKHFTTRPVNLITFLLAGACIAAAVYWHHKHYTFFTSIFLLALLIIARFIVRVNWLLKFYLVYAVLLVPFLIVNGLLTGTGLKAPVVWYNNAALIGVRLLTIPVEDIFYGMALILMNLLIYTGFKKRRFSQPAG